GAGTSWATGTTVTVLHTGQRTFLPARASSSRNVFAQLPQTTVSIERSPILKRQCVWGLYGLALALASLVGSDLTLIVSRTGSISRRFLYNCPIAPNVTLLCEGIWLDATDSGRQRVGNGRRTRGLSARKAPVDPRQRGRRR